MYTYIYILHIKHRYAAHWKVRVSYNPQPTELVFERIIKHKQKKCTSSFNPINKKIKPNFISKTGHVLFSTTFLWSLSMYILISREYILRKLLTCNIIMCP